MVEDLVIDCARTEITGIEGINSALSFLTVVHHSIYRKLTSQVNRVMVTRLLEALFGESYKLQLSVTIINLFMFVKTVNLNHDHLGPRLELNAMKFDSHF